MTDRLTKNGLEFRYESTITSAELKDLVANPKLLTPPDPSGIFEDALIEFVSLVIRFRTGNVAYSGGERLCVGFGGNDGVPRSDFIPETLITESGSTHNYCVLKPALPVDGDAPFYGTDSADYSKLVLKTESGSNDWVDGNGTVDYALTYRVHFI